MAAPRTKKVKIDEKQLKRSVQLIVFAPINADENDEDNLIFMVCPSTLKVVEIVEKFDDDAIDYLNNLGAKKTKNEKPAKDLMDDLGKEFEGEIEVAGEVQKEVQEIIDEKEEIASISDELDEDVVTFASNKLDDIFPDDGSAPKSTADASVDMEAALSLLDEDDDASDLESLADFVDDDGLPEL